MQQTRKDSAADAGSRGVRQRLDAKIRSWRQRSHRTAAGYIALGLMGLVIPIIPGALLVGFGLWLIFPNKTEQVYERFKLKFGRK